jgi:mono/diheme cytochrome c family protein
MKKYILICGFVLAFAIVFMQGCSNDASYPTICFTSQIRPIYVTNCAMSGCHDGSASSHAPHDVVLTDYTHIMQGIKPRHPERSKYYTELIAFLGIGNGGMPPSKPLSSQQISLIKAWIEQGADESDCTSSSCDTANVTYSGIVSAIFSINCNQCHNSTTTSGGVNLDGYNNLKAELDANKTNLLNAIGYSSSPKMPPAYELTSCEIEQINIWVRNGYPNN